MLTLTGRRWHALKESLSILLYFEMYSEAKYFLYLQTASDTGQLSTSTVSQAKTVPSVLCLCFCFCLGILFLCMLATHPRQAYLKNTCLITEHPLQNSSVVFPFLSKTQMLIPVWILSVLWISLLFFPSVNTSHAT